MTLFLGLLGSVLIGSTPTYCDSRKFGSNQAQKTQIASGIAREMRLLHEGRPHGVPDSYGWNRKPRLAMGNNPRRFKSMVAWGQVYEAAEGSPSNNTRIQIRDMKAYRFSKRDRKWYMVQNSVRVAGAAYREDFKNDFNKPANIRSEADGSISVKLDKNYNYHFWPAGSRVNIDPSDLGGILVTVYARLIPDRPQSRIDTSRARYVLNVGGDYWQNQTALWDNFKTNGEIGMGRFKYLTKNWQLFSMTTMAEKDLLCHLPPI